VSDGRYIDGGQFVDPKVWVAKLKTLDYDIGLPPRDSQPATGGCFGLRFRHPEVTGDSSAVVEVEIRYESLARSVPPKVLASNIKWLKKCITGNYPTIITTNYAVAVGWARGGRSGVLNEFKNLEKKGLEVDPFVAKYWRKKDAKSEQLIQVKAGIDRYSMAGLLAQEMIAWAIAETSGGTLNTQKKGRPRSFTLKNSLALIDEFKKVPTVWKYSPAETKEYFDFRPFTNWKNVEKEYQ
jgi:hypothetical protein